VLADTLEPHIKDGESISSRDSVKAYPRFTRCTRANQVSRPSPSNDQLPVCGLRHLSLENSSLTFHLTYLATRFFLVCFLRFYGLQSCDGRLSSSRAKVQVFRTEPVIVLRLGPLRYPFHGPLIIQSLEPP
jgi:hypothetical protein